MKPYSFQNHPVFSARIIYVVLLAVSVFIRTGEAQEVYNIDEVNGQSLFISDPSGIYIYDSGGPSGQYQNNESYEVTICTGFQLAGCPPNPVINARFYPGSIDIEGHPVCAFDGLQINNGEIYCNDNYPPGYNTTANGFVSDPSGCMTLRFYSNGSQVEDGFLVHFTPDHIIEESTPIICGSAISGFINFDPHGCVECTEFYTCQGDNYGPYFGVETQYRIEGEGELTLTIEGDIDFFVYGLFTLQGPNFCPPIVEIACVTGNQNSATFNASDFPYGIWVVIDGDFGDFEISLECSPCESTPVDCDQEINHTLNGFDPSDVDEYTDCSSDDYPGAENVYLFTPLESGIYRIHTLVSVFAEAPPIIVSDCCYGGGGTVGGPPRTQGCGFCAASGYVSDNENVLEVFLQAGVTYFIYIEDPSPGEGADYTFWIECPGYSCDNLKELECGFGLLDTNDPNQFDTPETVPTDFLDTHNECANDFDGCDHQGFNTTFDEHEVTYYFINTSPPTLDYDNNICIDVFPREADLDVDLFIYDDCEGDAPSLCLATSTRQPKLDDGVLLTDLPRFEDIYIVVDGQSHPQENNEGRYEIAVTCGNLCNKIPLPLPCGTPLFGELTQQDENVSSHYCCEQTENYPVNNDGYTGEDYSGGGNTGPEDIYYFDVESNGTTVTIELEILSPGQDLELFLLESCDVTTCLDRSIRETGLTETITYLLSQGRYYVVVEGNDFSDGEYKLTVSGCEDCALFIPNQGDSPNEVFFTNTTGWECKYFLVNAPYDSVGGGELLLSDSVAVSGNQDLTYHFPLPGCYELCFYYCDPQGVIYECCFKYCHEMKRYDCQDRPVIHVVNETATNTTFKVSCGGGTVIPETPNRSGQDCDSCHVSVTNVSTGSSQTYDVDENITLPFGEYEVCCWQWDPVCMYWNICCEIICLPYIRPHEEECLMGGITTVQQGNDYMFTYGGATQGLEWTVTPNLPHQIQNEQLIVPNPPEGSYKVCAIFDSSNGGIILRDTCCVYLCVDDTPNPLPEDCFDIIPVDATHVLLKCTTGRPVFYWEIIEWVLPVPITLGYYYGNSPLVELTPGKNYKFIKHYAGCCGEEDTCEREYCFICEGPDEYCDIYVPVYYENFDLTNPSEYPYQYGDSIAANEFWWDGQNGFTFGDDAFVTEDTEPVFLDLNNFATSATQVLRISFDFTVQWFRDLSNGSYAPVVLGDFCLADNNKNCLAPGLQELMTATPGIVFNYCGGGADIDFCYSHAEMIFDRTGLVRWYIDGRLVLEDQTMGTQVEYLRIDGTQTIDNVRIDECRSCSIPVLDVDDFVYCPGLIFNGLQHQANDLYTASFIHEGEGTAWSLFNANGILVDEEIVTDSTWTCPPLNPDDTYYVCRTYIDENGCEALCCIKFRIPGDCSFYTPYFIGDENSLEYSFEVTDETPSQLSVDRWFINSEEVGEGVDAISYIFDAPGSYEICCLFWDPFTECFIWCCREICVENPLDCTAVIIDYDGSEDEYILSVSNAVEIISWNIDQPVGLPNQGFIGSNNPQRFRPSDFSIQPGEEITISVRYVDIDGCIKICCKRLCIPVTSPVEECDNIFPQYLGDGLRYRYYVDPSAGMEDIQWRLHIPGTEQVVNIGSGTNSDDLDFEALLQQYPTLSPEQVCISILYKDVLTGCYRICCKCFCIAELPLECDDIIIYYSGNELTPYQYVLELNASPAQQIEWKIDESNTILGSANEIEVDFAFYGYGDGDNFTVTVRYYDEDNDCFRVCCRRICLVDPYGEDCENIMPEGIQNNVLGISTTASAFAWIIPGIEGIYSTNNPLMVDLNDPEIAAIISGQTEIEVCIQYEFNGCLRLCCERVCLISSEANCDLFSTNATFSGDQLNFTFSDNNQVTGLSTSVTLPDGQVVELGGSSTNYTSTQEGTYLICREYPDGCGGSIICCTEMCYAKPISCEPIEFTVDPDNEALFTFTHNIIGGESYYWDFGDGQTSTSDLTTLTHLFSQGSGSFTVCLTVTEECGEVCQQCINVAVGALNINPEVADPSCEGVSDGSIDLHLVGGAPPVNITWSDGTLNTTSLSNLAAGSYGVTVSDASGFDTTFTFVLAVPLLPDVMINVDHTSCGENNGSILVTSANATDVVGFDWTPMISDDDGHIDHLAPGQYDVVLTDQFGCVTSVDSIIVDDSGELLPVDLGPGLVGCSDEVIELSTGTINASNIQIEWLLNGEAVGTNTTDLIATGSGTYHVILTNGENCIREDSVEVTIFSTLLDFPEDQLDVIPGSEITLTTDGGTDVTWTSNDVLLTCTACATTSFLIEHNSIVFVHAVDINGCTGADTVNILTDISPVEGPNYITPNGDGINDQLIFEGLEFFAHHRLTIFNRWGQILARYEAYDNLWEGIIDGVRLPDGAYYYVLDYGTLYPEQFQFKSDLTIIQSR